VLPCGNLVVTLRVSGGVLRQTLEHAAAGREVSASVSGLAARVDRALPPGHRVTAMTLAGGRVVRDEDTLTLATFDFLADGGSGYSMLRTLSHQSTGVDVVDAFIAFLKRQPQPVRIARPYPARIGGTE